MSGNRDIVLNGTVFTLGKKYRVQGWAMKA